MIVRDQTCCLILKASAMTVQNPVCISAIRQTSPRSFHVFFLGGLLKGIIDVGTRLEQSMETRRESLKVSILDRTCHRCVIRLRASL